MSTWTKQMGFPLVTAALQKLDGKRIELRLSQVFIFSYN
jgi:aminopeptidase N